MFVEWKMVHRSDPLAWGKQTGMLRIKCIAVMRIPLSGILRATNARKIVWNFLIYIVSNIYFY